MKQFLLIAVSALARCYPLDNVSAVVGGNIQSMVRSIVLAARISVSIHALTYSLYNEILLQQYRCFSIILEKNFLVWELTWLSG